MEVEADGVGLGELAVDAVEGVDLVALVIKHGELGGIAPRVVVILIGTNNIPHEAEDQVVEGVETVVNRVRAGLPRSKVLLLGITPRGLDRDPSQVTTAPDPRVPRVNLQLARWADARGVAYLDIGPALLDGRGRVVQAIQPDLLHLSREGYRIWADAMEPTLRRLMGGE